VCISNNPNAELSRTNQALQAEIAERRRIQAALHEHTRELQANELRFRTIIEKSADGIVVVDKQGVVLFLNPAAETLFCRSMRELVGETFGFPIVGGEITELDVVRSDGRTTVVEMRVVETEWENQGVYLATFRDITERKQLEIRRMVRYAVTANLAGSETLAEAAPNILQTICEGLREARWEYGEMWVLDPAGSLLRLVSVWPAAARQPAAGKPSPREVKSVAEAGIYGEVCASGTPAWVSTTRDTSAFAHLSHRATRRAFAASLFPIFNTGEIIGVLAFFSRALYPYPPETLNMMNDLSNQIGLFIGHRRAEDELRSAHRALKTLNGCNQALIHATDETSFLRQVCHTIVTVGTYRLAWAGLFDNAPAPTLHLAAHAGNSTKQTTSHTPALLLKPLDGGRTPSVSRTIASGEPWIVKEVCNDPTLTAWHNQATTWGYRSFAMLPLLVGPHPPGILMIYASEADAFGSEEVDLLMELANNLAYGIVSLRTRAERDHAETSLRLYAERLKNMRDIDQAILTAQTPRAIAHAILSHIRCLVPCQWVNIVGSDGEEKHHVTLVSEVQNTSDEPLSFAPPGNHLPAIISSSMPGGLEPGVFQYVEDILTLPKQSTTSEQLVAAGIRSYINVPLIADGNLIGGITLGATVPHAFDEQQISIVRELAGQLAVAIQHARLFEQVRTGRERLQILSRRLMEAQEVERHHIARELHDEIGQSLTAVKMSLQAIHHISDRSAIAQYLDESITIVDQSLQQVRNLSLDLRPPLLDDLGLVAALRWYVDRHAQRADIVAEFLVDPEFSRLPPDLETVCFRVVQEALTNVVRHANAHHVHVELQQRNEELNLIIRDDGVGFDVRSAQKRAVVGTSMGLLGMQERVLLAGGQFEITSSPAGGTEVQARFSLAGAWDSERDV
jgi:signal transduction histidine kinase